MAAFGNTDVGYVAPKSGYAFTFPAVRTACEAWLGTYFPFRAVYAVSSRALFVIFACFVEVLGQWFGG